MSAGADRRFAPPPAEVVEADVRRALAEDLGGGDVTAALLPDGPDSAYLLCKEDAVVCGRPWLDACHRALDPGVRIDWRVAEGDRVPAGTVLATLRGRSRALVSAERSSLNFLQTLSGTATTVAAHVEAVRGTRARILDTRKTLPGLRVAQKYAVRVGGGDNHRMGLYDAVMLKENHVRAAGSIGKAIAAARASQPALPLIVEVETLGELREALDAGCDRILIDDGLAQDQQGERGEDDDRAHAPPQRPQRARLAHRGGGGAGAGRHHPEAQHVDADLVAMARPGALLPRLVQEPAVRRPQVLHQQTLRRGRQPHVVARDRRVVQVDAAVGRAPEHGRAHQGEGAPEGDAADPAQDVGRQRRPHHRGDDGSFAGIRGSVWDKGLIGLADTVHRVETAGWCVKPVKTLAQDAAGPQIAWPCQN